MNTSITARYVMLGLLFASSWLVVCLNLHLFICLILKKKVSRANKIIWPMLDLLLIFSIFDALKIEPQWIQVTHTRIYTNKIPAGSSLRIVQLSDLHLEGGIGTRESRMLALTARQQPDIIVLTGDYSSIKTPQTMSALTQIARRLSHIAPVYVVEGNWDAFSDISALREGGARLLGEWIRIKGKRGAIISIGGADWASRYVPNLRNKDFRVLLCHMPCIFESAANKGIDLTLVGHTHGGQIRLPIFGALMPDTGLVGRYQAGLYRKHDSLLYVNRGIGMEGGAAPRVRFWCRPEIAVIDIEHKAGN